MQPSTSTFSPTVVVKQEPGESKVGIVKHIDKVHTDTVLNFLLRLACQVNDSTTQNPANPAASTPGELLSRRCVILLKTALKPELWPSPVDLKLGFFDKILLTLKAPNPNIGNVCTALELLTYLLTVLNKDQLLASFKALQEGLGACITSTNSKIIKLVHGLLSKLMALFPPERSGNAELEVLYTNVSKVICDGLSNYEKNVQANPSSLFGTIMILKAACANNHSYIDLIITPFMKVLHRLAKEHLQPTTADYAASELQ